MNKDQRELRRQIRVREAEWDKEIIEKVSKKDKSDIEFDKSHKKKEQFMSKWFVSA